MANKKQQKDEFFNYKDENFELNPDTLEEVAGGRHYTTDPNDPDFDTFMYYGQEDWEKYFKH